MRKRLVACALAIALCIPYVAAQHVEEIPGGMKADVNGNEITLQFFSPGTLRVTKIPAGAPSPEKSLSVTATPAGVATSMRKSGGSVDIKSDAMTARLNLKDGSLTFYNAKGKTLLKENGAPSFTPVDDAGTPALKVKQRFAFDKDEAVYGLGNLENGTLSQRGITRTLMPGNVEDGIPVILSVKGYGIFWDNYSPTTFFDTPGESGFESEVGPGVDYYIMAGDNADGVIAEMRGLTGSVPMFPLWTYGFWQSRERYKSQDETVGVVKRYRELGVPLDGIIQDWQYWGNNYLWNAMEFMNPEFNNPQKMMDDIHSMNAHAIISIWSSFGPQTKPYRDLD